MWTTRRSALVLLCTAQFIDVLGATVVVVALPAMGDALDLSGGALQWVASSYALSFAALLLLCGRLADLVGRRRMVGAGLGVFVAGALLSGLAGSGAVEIAGRAVQGAGAAMVVPAALALVSTIFPEGRERDRAVATWTAVAAAGGAVGFVVGGVLTDVIGWRAVPLLTVVPGAVALALHRRVLPADPPTGADGRLDLRGAVTVTGALVLLVHALAGLEGGGGTRTWVELAAAGVLLWWFVGIERRAPHPLVPPRLLRRGTVSASALAGGTLTATTSGAAVVGTLYLQRVLGVSAAATGLVYVPFSLAVVAGTAIGPRLVRRAGTRGTVAAGLVGVTAALLLLSAVSERGGVAPLCVGLALGGAGLGVASVAATSAGVSAVADADRGVVSGVLNTAAQVGTAAGIAALLAVAAAGAGDGTTAVELVAGYRAAFRIAAAAAVLGLVAVVALLPGGEGARAQPASQGRAP